MRLLFYYSRKERILKMNNVTLLMKSGLLKAMPKSVVEKCIQNTSVYGAASVMKKHAVPLMTAREAEEVKRMYKPGMRIRCIHMDDPYPVGDGVTGTVEVVDDAGQIHVKWDNGRTLALIVGEDQFEIIG